LAEAGREPDTHIPLGISSAGPFRRRDGMIELVSPNICGGMTPERGVIPNDWNSVPLESVVRRSFEDVRIENDAVAGAVAERTFGAGLGLDDLLYVTWSTGIGTGAFVDGRIIRGKNGNAPHGGHVYLGLDGPVCGCGNRGDLESLASGTAMAIRYGSGKDASEVFRAYHDGDGKAREIVETAARYFARGLASMNSVLDTGRIVIGGSVFLKNIDLLLPMIEEEFYRSFPLLSQGVDIVPASLGEYLGDIAAVSLVIPDPWAEEWERSRPWDKMPETVFLEPVR
jgi:glucokinase